MIKCDCCGSDTTEPVASQLYEGATVCPSCAKADMTKGDFDEIVKFRKYLTDPAPHGQAKYDAHYGEEEGEA